MIMKENKQNEKKITYEDLDKLAKNILEALQKKSCKDEGYDNCPTWNLQNLIELLLLNSDLNYYEELRILEDTKDNILRYTKERDEDDEEEEEEDEDED